MSADTSHLQCLCGKVKEPASLLAVEHYPIEGDLCHCDTCRQSSGCLACAFFKLTGSPSKATLDACTMYKLPNGTVERYFCSTCGTRVFDHTIPSDRWSACSGTIEPKMKSSTDEGMLSVASHVFVGDTKDGGLAARLQNIGDKAIPLYKTEPDQGEEAMTPSEIAGLTDERPSSRSKGDADRLHAACSCGSIRLSVSPPTPAQAQHPEAGRRLRCDGTKYIGLHCVCRYCRLAAGFSITSHTYVMPENIYVLDEAGNEIKVFGYNSFHEGELDFDLDTQSVQQKLPALKFDFASPDVRRSFCRKCGASVFYENKKRPCCVNITSGILRAESGSLAKDWVEFKWDYTVWEELAVDPVITQALRASANM